MSPGEVGLRRTNASISVDGTPLPARVFDDLLEMRVARGTRTIGRASLVLADRTFSLAENHLQIGSEVKISALEPAVEIFAGVVTSLATDIDRDGPRVLVTAHDKSHVMARTRTTKTYAELSAKDIVEQLAGEHRLRAEVTDSRAGKVKETWFWRADSALGLLDELCDRLGWEWVVAGSTLRVVDVSRLEVPEPTCTLPYGDVLLRFSAEQNRPVTTEVTVRGWDPASKRSFTSTSTTPDEDKGFVAPGTSHVATTVVTRRGARTKAEADELAAALAAQAATVTARGRAHFSPQIEPGKAVKVTGTGPGDGTYYVREVEHVLDGGPLRTSFVAGFRPPALVTDPWSGRGTRGSVLANGIHTGVVTGVEDPEQLGRVQVKLSSVDDEMSLAWARVLAPGGGQGRGIQWTPEVQDEVLVGFEDGDARRPVVLGGLFNEIDLPPVRNHEGSVKTRTLVSAVGNKIEIGDGADAEYIDLVLHDGTVRLHLGADRVDLEAKDKPVRISSGKAEIVLAKDGTITIKGSTIKIEADQEVAVQGANVKGTASAGLTLDGATTTVKAKSSLKLQSTGVAELAGSMVKIN